VKILDMNLNEIYEYLNALIGTEDLGGDFSLKEFNHLIKSENISFFKDKVEELYTNQRGQALNPDIIYSTKMLRKFIKEDTVTPTAGTITLSSLTSYAYFISAHTTTAYNGMIRNIPLVTHETFHDLLTNLLAKPLKKNPVCVIDDESLRIKPSNITSVVINYFRFPTTPLYDYYVDANDNVVYLAVGGSHTLTAGETGSSGGTSGTVTSSTVELEYPIDLHAEFLNRLIGRLGLPKRDQLLLQSSTMEKQQEEAK
jgi:hypothetical protein